MVRSRKRLKRGLLFFFFFSKENHSRFIRSIRQLARCLLSVEPSFFTREIQGFTEEIVGEFVVERIRDLGQFQVIERSSCDFRLVKYLIIPRGESVSIFMKFYEQPRNLEMFYLISDGIRIGFEWQEIYGIFSFEYLYRIINVKVLTFCGCAFNMLFHLFLCS